jgi:hypothetical protein
MRCLSTLSGCGWGYGFTLTPLPPYYWSIYWSGRTVLGWFCFCILSYVEVMVKHFWGRIEHAFFHSLAEALIVEINTFVFCLQKSGVKHQAKLGVCTWFVCCGIERAPPGAPTMLWRTNKPCGTYDTLHTISKRKSSTMVRPPNYIYLISK